METRRLDPRLHRAAFDLAARAWPEAERAAYGLSIDNLLASGQEQLVVLLGSYLDEQLVAAQLAQVVPGNVAIVWRPSVTLAGAGNCLTIVPSLSRALASELQQAGVGLAQALAAPNDDQSRELFELGGFSRAAELLYMCAEPEFDAGLRLPFQIVPFTSVGEAHLEPLISRTYTGTLDCPRLDGLRETADVMAGYRAVGLYRPDLWFIVRDHDEDAGCLLLNLHPDVNHAEIVYLALVPAVRGRGWGLLLARFSKHLASQLAVSQVVLAVDAANSPARRAYESAGFSIFDRREVWLRAFHRFP